MITTVLTKICMITVVLAVLYLMAIMPRIFHKPDLHLFDGRLFAHRGLHDNNSEAPENSLAAFAKAVEAGFGIELDVHVTKDGIPVVFHDFSLKRMCGIEGILEEHTYEELNRLVLADSKQRIPTLTSVLELVNGRVPLIVEIKSEKADISECVLIDEVLRKYGGRYCIESFNPCVLLWYRLHHNDIARGQLSSNFRIEGTAKGPLYVFLTHLLLNFITKPDFIAYNHRFSREPSRCICKSLYRCKAAAWTVKSAEELERLESHYDVFIFDSFIP